MKRSRFHILSSVLLVGLPMVAGAVPPVALHIPPHVYTGRVLDYDAGNLATSRRQAEVRARKADGTLLARSGVEVVDRTICNYALTIPMSTIPSSACAVQGERLLFEVDNGEEIFAISNAFPAVGLPGRVTHVNLVAAKDENQNGVADSYEEDNASYMEVMGIEGPFLPDADYDGDGLSNYEEYLAGTDPFLAEDSLRILSMEQHPGAPGVVSLSFLPGQNRTYSVQSSTNLAGEARTPFRRTPYQTTANTNEPGRAFLQTGEEIQDVHFLYLIQEADHAFYRLQLD